MQTKREIFKVLKEGKQSKILNLTKLSFKNKGKEKVSQIKNKNQGKVWPIDLPCKKCYKKLLERREMT
jgi:hypothetical protein